MVADMEVDKVTDKVAGMVTDNNKKWPTWNWPWWLTSNHSIYEVV